MAVDHAALYDELRPLLNDPSGLADRAAPYPARDGRIWSFCPHHPDGIKHHKRSLSLSPTRGLYCFAGCRFTDVLADLRGNRPAPVTARRMVEPTATYLYCTADGRTAEKGRFEANGEKWFKWRLPGQEWEKASLGDALHMSDFLLWHYEQLAERPEEEVYFCEGEKATAALSVRGKLAVCLAGGASQRDFGQALLALAGRHVRIWSDNDPPGHELMQHVHSVLAKGITRHVSWVTVPLPEKGDAFDYFAGGGKLEALESGQLEAPVVKLVGNDAVSIVYPTGEGAVRFDFSHFLISSGKYEVELSVNFEGALARSIPVIQRINLLSASARRPLQLDLEARLGKSVPWAAVIGDTFTLAHDAYLGINRSEGPEDIPIDHDAPLYLVEPLILRGVTNVLFGDASSCKTFLGLGLCACVGAAAGLGQMSSDTFASVLYVDWEGDRLQWWRRWDALLLGLGVFRRPPGVRRWEAVGPLHEEIDAIGRAVKADGVELVVIDSAMPAAGGRPEEAEVAQRFFAALRRLPPGVTTVVLAHPNKTEQNPKWPLGSVAWFTMPRGLWRVGKLRTSTGADVRLRLTCTKGNDGAPRRDIGLRVIFDDDAKGVARSINIDSFDLREDAAAIEDAPLRSQLIELMKTGITDPQQLADQLDTSMRAVISEFRTHKDVFVNLGRAQGGRGNKARYGLLANVEAS